MPLLWGLGVLLLAEALAAATLSAVAARVRLVGDRRLAIEAELALETAIAMLRVGHDSTIAALAPGTVAVLPPPPLVPWEVRATVAREAASALVRLEVVVVRRAPTGRPLAARRGTLLFVVGAADTAIVIDSRPRS